MCDTCRPILRKQSNKFHQQNECVVANSFYCSICAIYGHTYKDCPQTDIKKFRETPSNYIIPPISFDMEYPDDYESWVEVLHDEEGKTVRAMLIANSVAPMTCQEKGRNDKKDVRENISRLREFLKKNGKKLVLIKPYTPPPFIPVS